MSTGTIAALLRVGTHRDHNSSYFLSGFFFFQGPGSLCHFTVDITELCGDKETEKNNNRPIDPHFTNLGGMGEIHLQGWNRPADWASIGSLLVEVHRKVLTAAMSKRGCFSD